jgi:hypothetical protein
MREKTFTYKGNDISACMPLAALTFSKTMHVWYCLPIGQAICE